MPVSLPRIRAVMLVLAFATGFLLLAANAMASPGGALYTQTNDPGGNSVQRFARAADGSLAPAGTFATGGLGLATLGGRQGAVELSGDGRYLYAVNAGSDSVSVFRTTHKRVRLIDTVASRGVAPASIDEHNGRVYVLNTGGTPSVTAYWRVPGGSLKAIATRALAPGADGAAQVSVMPDGRSLVVTERVANRLETLPLDAFGRPGAPVVTASSGAVPFGFGISPQGTVVVSEAGASSVSSYREGRDGALRTITASLAVGQGAACWVAVSPNGRFAYTRNAAGGISGFAIDRDGSLTAIGTTNLVPSPRDLDFDASGRYLHAVSPGGQVTSYRVGPDGALTFAGSAPAAAGITGAAAL
ncbi:MAG TPA: beta-propeller fold lactonase family protein [Solirubrobacteraceae bacterium]|nr:beta-propeller fold lactonase family protein [Solirubrobacteraceae bacterium]